VTAGLILTGGLAGCAEEPPPVVVAPPPPPPPPPPKPTVTSVADLMAQLSIDERVMLDEAEAPPTTEERIAVLTFFDGFARGDVSTLGSMMSLLDRAELDDVSTTDAWRDTVDGIEEITLETGAGPFGEKCVLALYDVAGEYQAQLWYFEGSGQDFQFQAAPSPPDILRKLSGDDWIARWHELLDEERQLAAELDVDPDMAPVDLDNSSSGSNSSTGGSPPSRAPGFAPGSAPGGPPGRRPPPPPRKPPGAR
jgi:hypothetical protein